MKYRDAIIKYFFHHNVSSHTKKRVFRYLADEQILAEKDDTMQKYGMTHVMPNWTTMSWISP